MMGIRSPSLFNAKEKELKLLLSITAQTSDGKWILARPYGLIGLYLGRRLKYAWNVFIGKYDVLKWEE
ncbi:MAG: hypothetical protein WC119_00400 [Synergistaceae bacterium]